METLRIRPKIISIFCVLGYLMVIISVPAVFSPVIKRMGDWYPALFGLFVALNFIAYIGIWHLKKWGVLLLAFTFFAEQSTAVLLDRFGIISCILGTASIIVFSFFYTRMSDNL
jgi:hypothetical protein